MLFRIQNVIVMLLWQGCNEEQINILVKHNNYIVALSYKVSALKYAFIFRITQKY